MLPRVVFAWLFLAPYGAEGARRSPALRPPFLSWMGDLLLSRLQDCRSELSEYDGAGHGSHLWSRGGCGRARFFADAPYPNPS